MVGESRRFDGESASVYAQLTKKPVDRVRRGRLELGCNLVVQEPTGEFASVRRLKLAVYVDVAEIGRAAELAHETHLATDGRAFDVHDLEFRLGLADFRLEGVHDFAQHVFVEGRDLSGTAHNVIKNPAVNSSLKTVCVN